MDASSPRRCRILKKAGPWLLARVATVTLVLLIAALVAGLAWWLDDEQLVLNYLRTLVWPLVVGTVLWWVRQPLRDKLADLLEVSAGGATAKFTQQQVVSHKLEEGIAGAASELVANDPGDGPEVDGEQLADEAQAQPEKVPSISAAQMTPPPLANAGADAIERVKHDPAADEVIRKVMAGAAERESKRRAAVEKVIAESASWGYNMAKIGFQGTPAPVIQWDMAGRPQILYARSEESQIPAAGHGLVVRGASNEAAARRLEAEIQRLERERAVMDTKAIGSMAQAAERNLIGKQIAQFQQQLRDLDPTSPWGLL